MISSSSSRPTSSGVSASVISDSRDSCRPILSMPGWAPRLRDPVDMRLRVEPPRWARGASAVGRPNDSSGVNTWRGLIFPFTLMDPSAWKWTCFFATL